MVATSDPGRALRVIVCVKAVPDPALVDDLAVTGHLAVASTGDALDLTFVPTVLNGFDEQALGAALQLRDIDAPLMVGVMTVDGDRTDELFRRAFELGAVDAVSVRTGRARLSARATGQVLAAAIRAVGGADIVMCGREASDDGQGLVGALVAAELEMAYAGPVHSPRLHSRSYVRALRTDDLGDVEEVEVDLPVLLAVSDDSWSAPRPRAVDILAARHRPVVELTAEEAGVTAAALDRHQDQVSLMELEVQRSVTACDMIDGSNAAEVARQLVERVALLRPDRRTP